MRGSRMISDVSPWSGRDRRELPRESMQRSRAETRVEPDAALCARCQKMTAATGQSGDGLEPTGLPRFRQRNRVNPLGRTGIVRNLHRTRESPHRRVSPKVGSSCRPQSTRDDAEDFSHDLLSEPQRSQRQNANRVPFRDKDSVIIVVNTHRTSVGRHSV